MLKYICQGYKIKMFCSNIDIQKIGDLDLEICLVH